MTRRQVCRFEYLQETRPEPTIANNKKNQPTFYPARGDGDRDINKYNPNMLAVWRANIDTSPILSKDALCQYIGKYATKAETQSEGLIDEVRRLAAQNSDVDGINRLLAQVMNTFCIERDFSAQEACHQMLGLPMVECSRVFESINLVQELCVTQVVDINTARPRWARGRNRYRLDEDGYTKLDRYMQRPPDMANLSYYDTVKGYNWNKGRKAFVPRRSDAIVLIAPYKWYEGNVSNSLLCLNEAALNGGNQSLERGRAFTSVFATAARRALLLYYPFTDFHALADISQIANPDLHPAQRYDRDDNHDQSWSLIFLYHLREHPNFFPPEIHRLVQGIEEEDFSDDDDLDDEVNNRVEPPLRREQEWQRLARLPANYGNIGRPENYLGTRDMDLQHDWDRDMPEEQLSADPETFIAVQKATDVGNINRGEHVLADALNEGQRAAFDHIVGRFRHRLEAATPEDASASGNIIVMGTAGVGKSFLIRAIEMEIWRIAKERFGEEAYPNVRTAIKLAAMTGKAAFQVGGVTLHSLLGITKVPANQLGTERLRTLQRDLRNTHYLFIDEMSLVGLKMLSSIDARLKVAFPANHALPFGGINIVMFGDFAQLPPVLDSALYAQPSDSSPACIQHGSKLYQETFTRVFHLQQQMRQQGRTEDELKFATLLTHLRSGEITQDDWSLTQSRVLAQLPAEERVLFQRDALALFPTNKQVNDQNISMLASLQRPVACIPAAYVDIDPREASRIKDEYCGGFRHTLYVSVGARVVPDTGVADNRSCC